MQFNDPVSTKNMTILQLRKSSGRSTLLSGWAFAASFGSLRSRWQSLTSLLLVLISFLPAALRADPTTTPTIAGGGEFTLFRKADASLWTVGSNLSGQLGDGTTTRQAIPKQLTGSVAACAAGFAHTLFIKTDGSLWGTGDNFYGELGYPLTLHRTPVQIATSVRFATAGEYHSLFVKQDGTLWAMGSDYYGQLGDGGSFQNAPVQVASGVQATAAGQYHSFFIKTDGTLWAMGDNGYGQLGDGTTIERDTPVKVASNVQKVSAGFNFSFFLKTDGTLWSMGHNAYGQLGNGTLVSHSLPTQVASNVQDISCGSYHTLFLKTDGSLLGVGWNTNGQLAITDPSTSNGYHSTPVAIATSVRAIAAGDLHTLFVRSDGTLWACGANGSGQLGDGGTTDRHSPFQVATGVALSVALVAPSVPAASAATNVTGSGFTAHWSSVSGATGYRLDVSTSSSFASRTTWNVGNVTSRSMSGLSASTIYYYRVRAYNSAGTSGNSNTISVKTLALQPPLAPTATAATTVISSGFAGNWSSVSGATGYRLDVSTSSSFSSYVSGYQSLNVGNVITRSVSGLSASKIYYYRVRAYNGAGTSGNSNVISVTTSSVTFAQMLSPTPGLPGSNGSTFTSSTVTFSWKAGVSVTEYFLYVGNSLGANDIYSGNQGLNLSHTVSNIPTDGRTIYVRLWSYINGTWYYFNYTYKAFKVSPAPNVTPYQLSGWSNKIVTTHTYGSTTDTSSLLATSPIYIDFAVINSGLSNVTTAFRTNLYVDSVQRTSFTNSSLSANVSAAYIGWSIGLLSPGSHTIKITTDSTNQVSESNEGDNTYSKIISVN
jgi:alpha-tubulin suppressor-like RCC1 family protein